MATEKQMTVAQMRDVMNKYKQKTCPPLPKTKSGIVKVLTSLNLPTTMKSETDNDKRKLVKSQAIAKMTKRDLIENITKINNAHKSIYNDWAKKDLLEHYKGLIKHSVGVVRSSKSSNRPDGKSDEQEGFKPVSYEDQLAEILAEAQRGPSAEVLKAFKKKKKK